MNDGSLWWGDDGTYMPRYLRKQEWIADFGQDSWDKMIHDNQRKTRLEASVADVHKRYN